ncbi:3-oxoacyl-[acyl-carrier-protein] synthase III C-terminal domain-containing protein [Streptomyces sp. NPDC058701]|uniref:3-oxoacyl-[acyl-carrier-protein] synthase III C-terminal domain-containing protein n=1 Tax=Streptomyces sp. NPDC058701 TaxID=3346608 RepID=UPI0036520F1D
MARTTLERVESYLPERSVRIEELSEHLGLRRAELGVFRKFYGLETLRFDPGLDLFDLLRPAARRVLDALPDGGRVAWLVYAHTTQAVTPADVEPAQVLRRELGLDGAEAFGLSHQACVSSLGALDVIGELLRAEGDENAYALMITGERAFSPIVQHIPNTAIMADAAAACLVTLDGRGDTVLSFVTRTLGEYADWLDLTPEQSNDFGQQYGPRIAEVIRLAVAEAGLAFDDIELIIPHNVNMLAWRQAVKALEVPLEKVFLDNVPRYSHTFASDVFVNYTTLRDEGRLVEGAHYVMVSVGLGATFGAMVITHHEGETPA